ncbi:MAG: SAF domain-containing protein [Actinomycetota bacterium]|nr:SAF domain-containing protein [Actinomycetota bacterium]
MTDHLIGSDRAASNDSTTPSIRRNLLSRVRLGHIVMALAALLALLFNLAVLRGNQATSEVVVATGDIRAGTALTMSHFDVAEVPADDLLSGRFVPATAMEQTVGKLATRSIAAGDPILESDLRSVENRGGLRAMSIPIDQTRAVSGNLAMGDSVDIVLVVDGIATYIATGIEVIDIPHDGTNALGARTGYAPTVAVDATQALRIVAALDTGDVHIIRSTGSSVPDLEQARAIADEAAEGSAG